MISGVLVCLSSSVVNFELSNQRLVKKNGEADMNFKAGVPV